MSDIIKVEFSQLWKADIIFTTSNTAPSIAIRQATNSIISHTILVTGKDLVIEAIEPTVREASWETALDHAEATVAIVMRRIGLSSAADQDKVVAAARRFNNLPYDRYGAASSGMYGSKQNQALGAVGCSLVGLPACAYVSYQMSENVKDENADKTFFCSELVSRAFSIAGFPIIDGKATFATPNTVLHSSVLQYVGHLPTKDLNKGTNLTEEQKARNRRGGWRKDN